MFLNILSSLVFLIIKVVLDKKIIVKEVLG